MRLPKVNIRKVRIVVIAVGIAGVFFAGGYFLGRNKLQIELSKKPKVTINRENPEDKKDVDFLLFWRTWDTIHASYFDKEKIDDAKLVYGAIKGMVSAVGDPYTVFLPPSENKVVNEDLQGNFEGVGIQIGFKGTQLAVIAPLPGTPAEKAGVKAGDFIVGIKDEAKNLELSTVGISLPDAVEAIRGEKGSKVALVLVRSGSEAPFEVEIQREAINVPSIVTAFVGEDATTMHLNVLKFGEDTGNGEWEKAVLAYLKEPKAKGIILDLRNNPGGYLESAVDLAGEFVGDGETIVIQENANGSKQEYASQGEGRLKKVPVVVLVNEGSASASEILAGALKDLGVAKIVGQTTFGKGTIQESIMVNGGSGLHITTAKWLTPKGTWVNGEGLKPDYEMKDNPETESDEQMDLALEILGRE